MSGSDIEVLNLNAVLGIYYRADKFAIRHSDFIAVKFKLIRNHLL